MHRGGRGEESLLREPMVYLSYDYCRREREKLKEIERGEERNEKKNERTKKKTRKKKTADHHEKGVINARETREHNDCMYVPGTRYITMVISMAVLLHSTGGELVRETSK